MCAPSSLIKTKENLPWAVPGSARHFRSAIVCLESERLPKLKDRSFASFRLLNIQIKRICTKARQGEPHFLTKYVLKRQAVYCLGVVDANRAIRCSHQNLLSPKNMWRPATYPQKTCVKWGRWFDGYKVNTHFSWIWLILSCVLLGMEIIGHKLGLGKFED